MVDGAVTSAPPIRHHINLSPSQPPTLQLCALVFPLTAHYNHLSHTSKPTLHDIASCSSSRLKFQTATPPDVQKSPWKRLPAFKKPPSAIRGWSPPELMIRQCADPLHRQKCLQAAIAALPLSVVDGAVTSTPPIRHHIKLVPVPTSNPQPRNTKPSFNGTAPKVAVAMSQCLCIINNDFFFLLFLFPLLMHLLVLSMHRHNVSRLVHLDDAAISRLTAHS